MQRPGREKRFEPKVNSCKNRKSGVVACIPCRVNGSIQKQNHGPAQNLSRGPGPRMGEPTTRAFGGCELSSEKRASIQNNKNRQSVRNQQGPIVDATPHANASILTEGMNHPLEPNIRRTDPFSNKDQKRKGKIGGEEGGWGRRRGDSAAPYRGVLGDNCPSGGRHSSEDSKRIPFYAEIRMM